jgi:DNA-binding transcriptional ArsR family regulator
LVNDSLFPDAPADRWNDALVAASGIRALVPTGGYGRSTRMVDSDGVAMLRALAKEDTLRVFAEVVAVTGTGLPERSGGATSIRGVTAHGVSRGTGLSVGVVVTALKRLTEAGLVIEHGDGGGWRTDFGALRRVAGVQVDDDCACARS